VSLRVVEFFGFNPQDSSATALGYRSGQKCPFVGGSCIKRFKSGTVSGACTVKPTTTGPVICCPNRMYAENYRVLLDIAQACFGSDVRLCHSTADSQGDGKDVQVFGKRWGKELRLPSRGKGGGYFVDWVLALVDPDRKLKEFVAVELQTMDTTGSYEAEVDSYYQGKTPAKSSTAGINWENVSKRILPQIIFKGHVLRREPLCTKGLFFICPAPVYQRILTRLGGKLEEYHPQAGALTFRWYDLAQDSESGVSRKLEFVGQRTTTIDQVALAFTSPSNLPPPRVYEQAILHELES
jgi:Restriction endonuclease NotI